MIGFRCKNKKKTLNGIQKIEKNVPFAYKFFLIILKALLILKNEEESDEG